MMRGSTRPSVFSFVALATVMASVRASGRSEQVAEPAPLRTRPPEAGHRDGRALGGRGPRPDRLLTNGPPRSAFTRWITSLPILLVGGLAAWAVGVSQIQRSTIGFYGLLAHASAWFLIGIVALLAGFLVELARRSPRGWLLWLHLVALIVAIHATVPLLYGTPEYAWVYKHIAVTQQLGFYGHLTDSSNIYQLWPALFAAAAAIAALGHVGPLTFATWAPTAFELANALLVLAVFRLLARERRVAWLAALLYVALISWVGQDYFSPQAFGYLLWLGIVLIVLRWLRATPATEHHDRLARLRAPLLVGLQAPTQTTARARALAVVLASVIFFAIVAAHQLTPYVALAGIGALSLLGLVRPRWLWALLAAIAVVYLIPRYGLIARDFGGLFSGGNPLANASGRAGTYHGGAEALTAWIVRGLAACMWLAALAAVVRQRRTLGRVAILAALAFSPFVMLGIQNYGGEAIYRVYLFSCPWCALLIAEALTSLRVPWRRGLVIAATSVIALVAGLQGLYGPVSLRAFTPAELVASRWVFSHAPRHELIVLPDDDFPAPEGANYESYDLQFMPSDPQIGRAWLDEGDMVGVERWIVGMGYRQATLVVSRSMGAYVGYFGAPRGYWRLVHALTINPGWSIVYHNADVTIYHFDLAVAQAGAPPPLTSTHAATSTPKLVGADPDPGGREPNGQPDNDDKPVARGRQASPTKAPTTAARVPATIAEARDRARSRSARRIPIGRVRNR